MFCQVNPLGSLCETTCIPAAWTQIQSCFSLHVILRWNFYSLPMNVVGISFPLPLFVCVSGGSSPAACLVSGASDASREYFLWTQDAISSTHRKYYHQCSQHSFSTILCLAHHIQCIIPLWSHRVHTALIPILQMRRLSLGEIQWWVKLTVEHCLDISVEGWYYYSLSLLLCCS